MLHAPRSTTLAFRDAALEREFLADDARSAVRAHRIIWTSITLLFTVDGFADAVQGGSDANVRTLLILRYAIFVPLLPVRTLVVRQDGSARDEARRSGHRQTVTPVRERL